MEARSFEEVTSPVFIYASPAFCSIVGYEPVHILIHLAVNAHPFAYQPRQDELRGRPLSFLNRPLLSCLASFSLRILARMEAPVGEPFLLETFCMGKSRTLRTLARSQFLYGNGGVVSW